MANCAAAAASPCWRRVSAVAEADRRCWHCSEPLPLKPERADIDGRLQSFCCHGCAAAARFIRDSGLGDYYRLRSAPGGRARDESLACSGAM